MEKLLNKRIIVISVLVLLLAGLIFTAVLLTGDGNSSENPSAESNEIPLAAFSVPDVTVLEYGKGDSLIKLEKSSGKWTLKDYPERETDGELISEMLSYLTKICAVRTVDEGNLSDFGLDRPSLTVNVRLADGTKHTYNVGIKNSFNGYSYILVDGKVYMFSDSLTSHFDKDIKDVLRLSDVFPSSISQSTVMSLAFTAGDGTSVKYTSCTKMSEFLASLKLSFSFNELALLEASDSELKECGIDSSSVKVSIFYNAPSQTTPNLLVDATFTLQVGEGKNGKIYYVADNSHNIYEADADSVSRIFEGMLSHAESHEDLCVSKSKNK